MRFIKLNEGEKFRLLLYVIMFGFLGVVIILMFQSWGMADRISMLQDKVNEQQYIMEFLTQWIKQNDVVIKRHSL